ncbi:MAG: dihydrolipoamide acetyltransferase family protein [Candidatus Pelagadaptatus aseana]|uniref:2-oxo acid dehydrogenase subunit E2 n=1 Tax=Candidatus Pelagadaptatus aseana TaxID=3120508 RepID=UPI0039B2F0E7
MRYFKLPDLGEGLQEAEIVEWQVNAGDCVAVDDVLVVVETAKALVEIPSPQAGVIARCFGQAGDFIHIGEPLVEYDNATDEDTGTVVGEITQTETDPEEEDFFIIGAAPPSPPADDKDNDVPIPNPPAIGGEPLRGPRRAMAKAIGATQAHSASVTLCEDADIEHWDNKTDVTVQLCHAMVAAIRQQPLLNAWFDERQLTLAPQPQIDLALAVNTDQGLFAPVLRDIANRDDSSLRQGLNALRQDVHQRSIPVRELQGATIALSNFGTLTNSDQRLLCGRYATPMIIPPAVAIIGAGGIRQEAKVIANRDGEKNIEARKTLPLSLSFDHRVVTGAEAAHFLSAFIAAL